MNIQYAMKEVTDAIFCITYVTVRESLYPVVKLVDIGFKSETLSELSESLVIPIDRLSVDMTIQELYMEYISQGK